MGKRATYLPMRVTKVPPSVLIRLHKCDVIRLDLRRTLEPIASLHGELKLIKVCIRTKASSQAPVGYVKVHYRGFAKNPAQLHMLFTQVNLWLVRGSLMRSSA